MPKTGAVAAKAELCKKLFRSVDVLTQ